MNNKFINKEVLTYKLAGEDIPMGPFYRLENGVKCTPELLRELIALNQEVIDAHKAVIGMLNTYQTSLTEMLGLPKTEGYTWWDLALKILEFPAKFRELEAVIAIETVGMDIDPLMVKITEIITEDECGENGTGFFVNCWGDFTTYWPDGETPMEPSNLVWLN